MPQDSDRDEVRSVTLLEFQAQCLELVSEVVENGSEVVITREGLPVSRLVPFRERPKTLFGINLGRFEIIGDVISPIGVRWEAEVDPDRVLNP